MFACKPFSYESCEPEGLRLRLYGYHCGGEQWVHPELAVWYDIDRRRLTRYPPVCNLEYGVFTSGIFPISSEEPFIIRSFALFCRSIWPILMVRENCSMCMISIQLFLLILGVGCYRPLNNCTNQCRRTRTQERRLFCLAASER